MQAVADHVAHHQCDPGPGQRDDIEPVAADACPGGQIAVGDLDGGLVGQGAGQQAALQGRGQGMLAGVPAGVVDGHRGPGGQLLGEGQVLFLEGVLLRTPEVDHTQYDAASLERHGDQGVEAALQDAPGAFRVLGPPAVGSGQVGLEDGVAVLDADGHGAARNEADEFPHREEGPGPAHAVNRRAAQFGALPDGLVPLQDRILQVDRGDVGEAGGCHLGQFLGGAHHIQRGADPHACLVQQAQPLSGHGRPARQCLQLRGVAQRGHTAPLSAVLVDGTDVDRQQVVAGQVDLVGGRPAREQQFGGARFQTQLGDVALLGVRGQIQQSPCLVVGQQQPSVTADDQYALPYRVQHRVVVLVHPGHLGRTQAVRLPAQPP